MNNIYRTKILTNVKPFDNDYVLGKIMGAAYVLCNGDPNIGYAIVKDNDGSRIISAFCSKRKYKAFVKVVEEMYPGLCIFNYVE